MKPSLLASTTLVAFFTSPTHSHAHLEGASAASAFIPVTPSSFLRRRAALFHPKAEIRRKGDLFATAPSDVSAARPPAFAEGLRQALKTERASRVVGVLQAIVWRFPRQIGRFIYHPVLFKVSVVSLVTGLLTKAFRMNESLDTLKKDQEDGKTARGERFLKVAGRYVTPLGVLWTALAFVWALWWYPLLLASWLFSMAFDNDRRRLVDWVVQNWARCVMVNMTYQVKVTGLANLPPPGENALYVPNHTSFLDIMTLSAYLPARAKYISKAEILNIPLIGWAMRMAAHIAIRRGDRRSQLQTFREAVDSLKKGNSLIAFAEETRSVDGRLRRLKPGTLRMAQKAGTKVIPVSLCGVHKWYPQRAWVPLGIPEGVTLHLHPPIDPTGRDVDDLLDEVATAINSGLPSDQRARYLEEQPETEPQAEADATTTDTRTKPQGETTPTPTSTTPTATSASSPPSSDHAQVRLPAVSVSANDSRSSAEENAAPVEEPQAAQGSLVSMMGGGGGGGGGGGLMFDFN